MTPRPLLASLAACAVAIGSALMAAPAAEGVGSKPTARALDARIAVGDSITVGASPLLRLAGFTVNARVGRQFYTAPAILRSYGANLPANVVIELGTNGLVRMRDCRAVLSIAGPYRKVFFVTNRMARDWQDPNNRTLRRCVAASRGTAQLIDWYSASDNAVGWFAPDRVHLTKSGSLALATLIDLAVDLNGVGATPAIPSPSPSASAIP